MILVLLALLKLSSNGNVQSSGVYYWSSWSRFGGEVAKETCWLNITLESDKYCLLIQTGMLTPFSLPRTLEGEDIEEYRKVGADRSIFCLFELLTVPPFHEEGIEIYNSYQQKFRTVISFCWGHAVKWCPTWPWSKYSRKVDDQLLIYSFSEFCGYGSLLSYIINGFGSPPWSIGDNRLFCHGFRPVV